MTRETAPAMIRIADLLTEHADFLAEHKIYGIPGIVDYITAPGYGHRYDADNPLPGLTSRIGRIGSRVAGVHRRSHRHIAIYSVGEERIRAGNLLLDIANSIDSLMTGGQPVGAIHI